MTKILAMVFYEELIFIKMKLVKCFLWIAGITGVLYGFNYLWDKRTNIKKSIRDERFYSWRHGSVRYIVRGQGTPVLLVHDLSVGGCLTQWREMIALLSKRHTVYAIDLIGFGFSDKPALTHSDYLHASLVNDFVRDVIGEKTVLMTNGKSAWVGLAGYHLDKGLFDKLVFVNPSVFENTSCVVQRLIELPVVGTSLYYGMTSRFALRKLFGKADVGGEYEAAHFGGRFAKYSAAGLFGVHFCRKDALLRKEIDVPVLVFGGSDNGFLEEAERISDRANGCYKQLLRFIGTKS